MRARLRPPLVLLLCAAALAAAPAMAAGFTAARNATVAAAKVPPVNVSPVSPHPGQKITVSFKVTKRAPAGWYWWFSVYSLNKSQKNCAQFAYKIFKTRGTVGQTLRTAFAPQMDTLRRSPKNWCGGKMAAEAQIDSYADSNFKHSKLVGLSLFRVL
jgi:hypothetical protein